MPLGQKARRTRTSILAAAAGEFSTRGYLATTMGDIAAAAGLGLGSVYQYFRDRTDVVAALTHNAVRGIERGTDVRWRVDEGVAGLERILTNFIRSYSASGGMARIWEEVSFVDPSLAELRREMGRLFTRPVENELRRAQATGALPADVDPTTAARALTAMVDRWCYVTYVFDPPIGGPPTPEEAGRDLARLWARAVGMQIS